MIDKLVVANVNQKFLVFITFCVRFTGLELLLILLMLPVCQNNLTALKIDFVAIRL